MSSQNNFENNVAAANPCPLNCYTSVEPLHVISLGAGVQSSTLALMAAKGEITPMPSCAVFSDTQAEPESVYKWLDWLETQLPFPVHRVSTGNLLTDSLHIRNSKKYQHKSLKTIIPFFLHTNKGKGMVWRKCTGDYKVVPIQKFLKQYKKQTVIQWLGISVDEAHRQKDSRKKWIENRYPLIEARFSRSDCLRWMEQNKFPTPPRSACIFCPYRADSEWLHLKNNEPKDFQKAVQFERDLQEAQRNQQDLKYTPYLHATLKPLDQIQFRHEKQKNLFGNECEGMCGI